MKPSQLIVMNIIRPTSCIHTNRDEWQMTHVTEPRPSCLSKWQVRDSLRSLAKGQTTTVDGIEVHKNGRAYHKKRYVIAGEAYTFEDAIAVIEAARKGTEAA